MRGMSGQKEDCRHHASLSRGLLRTASGQDGREQHTQDDGGGGDKDADDEDQGGLEWMMMSMTKKKQKAGVCRTRKPLRMFSSSDLAEISSTGTCFPYSSRILAHTSIPDICRRAPTQRSHVQHVAHQACSRGHDASTRKQARTHAHDDGGMSGSHRTETAPGALERDRDDAPRAS